MTNSNVPELFGSLVFNQTVMKEMLPEYIRPYGIGNLEMYAQALFGDTFNTVFAS